MESDGWTPQTPFALVLAERNEYIIAERVLSATRRRCIADDLVEFEARFAPNIDADRRVSACVAAAPAVTRSRLVALTFGWCCFSVTDAFSGGSGLRCRWRLSPSAV